MSSLQSSSAFRRVSSLLVAFALLISLQFAQPTPGYAAPSAVVNQMISEVNQVRTQAGLLPLSEAEELSLVATERSSDMVTRNYFGHTTPDGRTVFTMLHERGIIYNIAGENLAWNNAAERSTSSVAIQGFLNSPTHRDILLSPEFSQIGVGVANQAGRTYFTLVFLG